MKPLGVTVLLLDGGFASTAVGPIEVFSCAGLLWNVLQGEPQQPRFNVRAASLDGRSVPTIGSLDLQPHVALGDVEHTDIVIIGSAGIDVADRVAPNPMLQDWLRAAYARGTLVGSVCSGVACVAATGLLDGRRATTHWALADGFRDRYPKVLWQPEQFVTEDRRLYCSGGVYAAIDLSLFLVGKLCGREVALQTARSLLVSMPRVSQAGYGEVALARQHSDERIREAEDYLQRHFNKPVSTEALAKRLGMSPRNLIRRFKAATEQVPGAYVQNLRIAAARELLEQGNVPIQTVSVKVGYEDAAFFRSLFKRHTGMTPVEYRSRFAPMCLERGDIARG